MNWSELEELEWKALQAAHEDRMRPRVEATQQRRCRQGKDPIEDFLFEYYFHSPSHLLRWSPGIGVLLRGESAAEFLERPGFSQIEDGVIADPEKIPSRHRNAIPRTLHLQKAIQSRPPYQGCMGLHEWAMVYDPNDIRHPQLPLRLGVEGTRRVVESFSIHCTHYDAFRFFSKDARRFNRLQPRRDNREEMEQPGCLHANMDLYTWAARYAPWIESDLIADAFDLAMEIRVVDMRASAYDTTSLGLVPICIETQEGRREFRALQLEFARRAAPIRTRLIAALERLLVTSPA